MANEKTGYLWYEEGEPKQGIVAEVAPMLPVFKTFTFAVPPRLAQNLTIGQRVIIAVGRSARHALGYVIALDRRPWDSTLRSIVAVKEETSYLTPELIALGKEISAHYHCPLGITLKAMTPQAVRTGSGLKQAAYLKAGPAHKAALPRSKKRRAILDYLAAAQSPVRLEALVDATRATKSLIRDMAKAGQLVVEYRTEELPFSHQTSPQEEPDFVLSPAQKDAINAIYAAMNAGSLSVHLLYGVSGSGKTEVYIHAIRNALRSGKQALLLIPEIVLTTQLVARLAGRFQKIAVLHSELPNAQRAILWRKAMAGEYPVIIGTRSAVFAPLPNLGLICVDEEQETSYKNLQAPRFHVRDVAIMRARLRGIPVVLGSATPSLETWHRAHTRPDYKLLVLPARVRDLPMPRLKIVDMCEEFQQQKKPVIFSHLLEDQLSQTLHAGEQAILLMNRRGFANRLFCPKCNTRITCPHCSVGLVVHSATGQSICHYCRRQYPTPATCPNVTCRSPLMQFGVGTQRVEQILQDRFPTARIRRVDSDTMRRRADYQRVIDDVEQHRLDIIVGTQMIAKGLDFPKVSLVGVIAADPTGLSVDFRAAERLFQLVTQVAGRAGRADRPGQAIIQSLTPNLPPLLYALRHDFEGFADAELRLREKIGWPPFQRLARLVISHPREQTARITTERLAGSVAETMTSLGLDPSALLGPNACPIARAREKYRYELLIRVPRAADLRRLLDELEARKLLAAAPAGLTIDVDPVDFL